MRETPSMKAGPHGPPITAALLSGSVKSLLDVLCTRYEHLSKGTLATAVAKLKWAQAYGPYGDRTNSFDPNAEPLRLKTTVDHWIFTLDLNNAGVGNYEALLGNRTAKHDPSRNEYQKDYQKNRYHERKDQAIKMLGGKCVKCDSTSNLELDHKNPDNKSFTITKLWSVPEAEFKKEVKKCRLLCRKHHLEHSGKQREKGEVKSKPGKSEYGKDNRKKASTLLQKIARGLAFDDVAKIGATVAKSVASLQEGVRVSLASAFKKSDPIDRPVITWNVFDHDSGSHQLLFRVYGREKDAKLVAALASSVKGALSSFPDVTFDYEDDLSEPGLSLKTVSGLCK